MDGPLWGMESYQLYSDPRAEKSMCGFMPCREFGRQSDVVDH